ncbi:MAG: TolC family protein, partial [Planctomycetota bacterium]
SVSQPLLRGFGEEVNTAEITLGRNQKQRSIQALKADLLLLIAATEQAYWELVQRRDNLLIQQRLVDQGIEVRNVLQSRQEFDTRASQYADAVATVEQRQATLLVIQRNVKLASDQLKAIMNDPNLPLESETLILATDPLPEEPLQLRLREALATAMRERPEVEDAIVGIEDASIRERVAKNLRWPELNVNASVSYGGLDGNANEAYKDLTEESFVNVIVGISLEYPFGNRAAKAEILRARLQRDSSLLRLRRVVQGVILEVKNALRDVQTNYALIQATRSFRIAQAENLRTLLAEETEQQRPTPEFLDLKFRRQELLSVAQREEVASVAAYNSAIAELNRAMGTGLRQKRIELRTSTGTQPTEISVPQEDDDPDAPGDS